MRRPEVTKEVSSYARRPKRWRGIEAEQWADARWQLRHRITSAAELQAIFELNPAELAGFEVAGFAVGMTPHYVALMDPKNAGCPVRAQAVPRAQEAQRMSFELDDPLGEESHMPVPGLTHRYPDRALLYISQRCPVYCRHCTRKRKVSQERPEGFDELAALDYLRAHPEIRDVLVSGGEPLMLSNSRLRRLLSRLRALPQLDVIRLCTRAPVTWPQRIDGELVALLQELGPLVLSTHFNSPAEASLESSTALSLLRQAGLMMVNQSVLLAGVNDQAEQIEALNRWLLRQGVHPYYLFQCDMAPGITHFRTPLSRGIEIIDELRGQLSGLGIPHFVVDLPGGHGKVTLGPKYILRREGEDLVFRSSKGVEVKFRDMKLRK